MRAQTAVLLERLKALDFDGELENLGCLLRVPRAEHGAYPEVLAALEPQALSGDADAAVLRGKLLLSLGRAQEGAEAIENAPEGSSLPSEAWRGQALLLSGRFSDAAELLERAAQASPDYAWTFFWSAAAKLGLGEVAAARRDCEAFQARGGGAAGWALAASVAMRAGDLEQAAALLTQAQARAGSRGWPSLFKARLRAQSGDWGAAAAAAGEAIAVEPAAAHYEERASFYERLGEFPRALRDAQESVRLCPCPDHYAFQAHLHRSWRQYAEAAEALARAVALAPQRAQLRWLLSQALACDARLGPALLEAEAASALDPEDPLMRCWHAQVLIWSGRGEDARRQMLPWLDDPSPMRRARAHFILAYDALCARRWAQAREELERSLACEDGTPWARKVAFYRTLALALDGWRPSPEHWEAACVLLAGLGMRPPYSACVGSLKALGECDVLFNNVVGEEVFELLRVFCKDVRPLAYHQDFDEDRLADTLLAAAAAGRRVGFVTRGHATVYGGLGRALYGASGRSGLPAHGLASITSTDMLTLKLIGASAGLRRGVAVLDVLAEVGSPGLASPRVPLFFFESRYDDGGQKRWAEDFLRAVGRWDAGAAARMAQFRRGRPGARRYEEFTSGLARRYGPAQPCWVYSLSMDAEPARCRLDGLAGVLGAQQYSPVFFIAEAS